MVWRRADFCWRRPGHGPDLSAACKQNISTSAILEIVPGHRGAISQLLCRLSFETKTPGISPLLAGDRGADARCGGERPQNSGQYARCHCQRRCTPTNLRKHCVRFRQSSVQLPAGSSVSLAFSELSNRSIFLNLAFCRYFVLVKGVATIFGVYSSEVVMSFLAYAQVLQI